MSLEATRGADWLGGFPIIGPGLKKLFSRAVTLVNSAGTEMNFIEDQYEPIAAGATSQPAGATGATGDFLAHLVIQPTSTSPGAVTVKDGTTTVYTWPGGTVSAALYPIDVPLGLTSVNPGGWIVTTGLNVTALPCGRFT